MKMPAITVTDVFIFAFGIVAGVAFGYCVGKLVFSHLFKKQEDAITVENVGKFTAVQQGLNYLLGFALGAAALSPQLGVVLLLFWLGVQTYIAVKIFGFDSPVHGLTYALIDTGSDLLVGALFGAGAATFTLFRLALMTI